MDLEKYLLGWSNIKKKYLLKELVINLNFKSIIKVFKLLTKEMKTGTGNRNGTQLIRSNQNKNKQKV